jgi:hypothetical protein
MIKSKEMRGGVWVARLLEMKYVHSTVFTGKIWREKSFGTLWLILEDNIKIDIADIGRKLVSI